MKKRTKIELVIFAVVALVYLGSLLMGKTPEQPAQTAQQQTSASFIELPQESFSAAAYEAETTGISAGETGAAVQGMPAPETSSVPPAETGDEITVEAEGAYTDAKHVALYIHVYGQLPSNYVTKQEAEAAGWDAQKGNLGDVLPGCSIGGGRFGNREKLLPEKKGRKYYECDIDYDPEEGHRGPKRIVYSNDGLIYYTEDHYNTFTLMYGDEK